MEKKASERRRSEIFGGEHDGLFESLELRPSRAARASTCFVSASNCAACSALTATCSAIRSSARNACPRPSSLAIRSSASTDERRSRIGSAVDREVSTDRNHKTFVMAERLPCVRFAARATPTPRNTRFQLAGEPLLDRSVYLLGHN